MNKFAKFQKSHDAAVESINHILRDQRYAQAHPLIEWLMTTDANPYGFMPRGYEGAMGSAQSFDLFLSTLLHAIYDDGDLTFVTVNDEPRIVLASQHDDDFNIKALNQYELDRLNSKNFPVPITEYVIKVMNVSPGGFVEPYIKWQKDLLQRCFVIDAAKHGTEWAKNIHCTNSVWDDAWVIGCQARIESMRRLFK